MSFDYSDAEAYLSDGVRAAWWEWQTEEELERDRIQLEIDNNRNKVFRELLTELMYESSSNERFISKVLSKLIKGNVISANKRYLRLEGIENNFFVFPLQDVLLDSFISHEINKLAKIDPLKLSLQLSRMFTNFASSSINISAYQKVTKIQLLIHKSVGEQNEIFYSNPVIKQKMSNLLSFCRLYFLNEELVHISRMKLKRILENNRSLSLTYKYKLPKGFAAVEKQVKHDYHKRHMHSLIFYFSEDARKKVSLLMRIDCNDNASLLIDKIAKILNASDLF